MKKNKMTHIKKIKTHSLNGFTSYAKNYIIKKYSSNMC